ncbi:MULTISPECIES: AraC family transcriptional regulator [unclassified Acinetobacter]|uniref:AraC family transcriptional regulator n=1 Tax=unclassified Acinetobacter TaxID=196816 RepID=UPI000445D5D9|nr:MULTISPECIES: AraC family transcriptional regulator [unclassified Acinetobacter]EZQ07147.1 AraC family transcriptional regulator [Acinetobacter sp. Ver3]SEL52436.1 AraC-type DNA-binding protein [Acinetobacter sp. DSM 11652]
MQQIKDYSGSVHGGLGHLLHNYCEESGLPISAKLASIQQAERFDFSIWREILNEIYEVHPQPALGLEIAQWVKPQHLGIIAYIALSCDNLAEALTRYHEYHRLIYDGTPLAVDLEQGVFSVRWEDLPMHLSTQITDEIAMALLVEFLKRYAGIEHLHIQEIHFRFPAPKNIAIYERFFQSKVKFSQPHVKLTFPSQLLQAPIKQADQTLQKLLMQQAQDLLSRLPNNTQIDERLQQAILIGIQRHNYQIQTVAEQVGMSVRQLQRHLQNQGDTYQQRVQEVRKLLAIQYLQDPYLSLHEISLLLSYSEQSAFQRAFRQWMKMTPQQWRIQHHIRT